MTKARSLSTRIEELQKRQAELHEIEKQLRARKSIEDRKADAHRKIEVGATVESVLGRPIQHNELDKLFFYLRDQENRGQYFSRAMNADNPSRDTPHEDHFDPFPQNEDEEI